VCVRGGVATALAQLAVCRLLAGRKQRGCRLSTPPLSISRHQLPSSRAAVDTISSVTQIGQSGLSVVTLPDCDRRQHLRVSIVIVQSGHGRQRSPPSAGTCPGSRWRFLPVSKQSMLGGDDRVCGRRLPGPERIFGVGAAIPPCRSAIDSSDHMSARGQTRRQQRVVASACA
jgi:hypothetical protein